VIILTKVWIKENRSLIDEVVENVRTGKRHQHCLVYGE
jgi:hypothetical protein